MTTPVKRPPIPADLHDTLAALAAQLDMDTSTYIAAVLRGAAKQGNIHRLAEIGADGMALRRRHRERFPWKSLDAGHWAYEDWRLTRLGEPGPYPKPGDGWYLTGPDVDDTNLGCNFDDVVLEAEQYIRGTATYTRKVGTE